jgi:enterochelin esterase family protein
MDLRRWRPALSGLLLALPVPVAPALAAPPSALDDPLASPRLEQLRLTVASALSADDRAAADAALAAFWADVRRDGAPLVEPAGAAHPNERLVTFLYQSEADTHVVILADFGDYVPHMTLQRLSDTDVWYRSLLLPDDARFLYELSVDDPAYPFTGGDSVAWPSAPRPDPLNPRRYDFAKPQILSLVELPRAPSLELSTPDESVPHGELDQRGEVLKSAILGNERKVFLYKPPGYRDAADAGDIEPYPLLIFGASYINQIRLPVILDHLIARGRIPPVVAVFVGFPPSAAGRNVQDEEAGGGPEFSDFIATELLPWVRERVHVSADPRRVVIGGASAGGHGAACVALRHPEAIGGVIAQSGAFWRGIGGTAASWSDPARDEGREGFARLAASSPLAVHDGEPVRFELTVGRLECGAALSVDSVSMLHASRHVRDVLAAKGYPVTLRESSGGHDPYNWETSLPAALEALLAPRDEASSARPR